MRDGHVTHTVMNLLFSRVASQSMFSLSPSSQLLLHEHPTIEKTITHNSSSDTNTNHSAKARV
jgi:hypothetical protein